MQPITSLNVINDETKNVLILRMRNVPAMDISGLDALEETLAICQKRGMTLLLSHVNAQPTEYLKIRIYPDYRSRPYLRVDRPSP